jgi:pyruvate formate lyase activating enzyme
MAEARPDLSGDPLLFSVQHFCLQDGPGVRSLVFFKGCPLRCVWCQNPESWRASVQVGFKKHLCIDCRACVQGCPAGALIAPGRRDDRACVLCLTCARQCPSGALTTFGERRGVSSLVEELRPEFPYYRNTGGGVTLTGGEPTLWPEYGRRLARALKSEGLHLAVETCGLFRLTDEPQEDEPAGPVWDFLGQTDLILFDVKVFDDLAHRRLCGAPNREIKRNLSRLAGLAARGEAPPVWPRLPLIPRMTDGAANLSAWADFLNGIGLTRLTLVPYHNLGLSKRDWLGLDAGPDLPELTEEDRDRAATLLRRAGIQVFAPGDEDW